MNEAGELLATLRHYLSDEPVFESLHQAENFCRYLVRTFSRLDLVLSHGGDYPPTWQRAKLYVRASSSNCGACGGEADPADKWHVSGGPGGPQNGCRARFTSTIHLDLVE